MCPAYQIAGDYLNGSAIRQDYLETALKWISAREGIEIEDYMSQHQHDTNCNELWLYFQTVINWVKATFPKYRSKLMKGLEWGIFYNKYGTGKYDPKALESRIIELIEDYRNGYISNQKGIYEYLFDGQERHLNIRAFSPEMARAAYERQKVSAQNAESILKLKKCKLTISCRGVRVERQLRKTVKCFVQTVTAARVTYKISPFSSAGA